jgi:putative NADPH-quinone reductase
METKRIAVVQGHPDADPARFCRALGAAYAEAAVAAGHTVDVIDVAALDFPVLRSSDAFEHDPLPATLDGAQYAIGRADHLVFIYPLWLGSMPALLKAFLEQVMRPGFAIGSADAGQRSGGLLKGKSARIVVTMGMPALIYRWYFGAHSLKSLERNILRFAGIGPIRESLIGMVGATSDTSRRRWIERMRTYGEKGA